MDWGRFPPFAFFRDKCRGRFLGAGRVLRGQCPGKANRLFEGRPEMGAKIGTSSRVEWGNSLRLRPSCRRLRPFCQFPEISRGGRGGRALLYGRLRFLTLQPAPSQHARLFPPPRV